jgi:hypothetical protein
VKIEEDIEDGFDAREYVHLLKKWTHYKCVWVVDVI